MCAIQDSEPATKTACRGAHAIRLISLELFDLADEYFAAFCLRVQFLLYLRLQFMVVCEARLFQICISTFAGRGQEVNRVPSHASSLPTPPVPSSPDPTRNNFRAANCLQKEIAAHTSDTISRARDLAHRLLLLVQISAQLLHLV
jgi:hypothetical protein